MLLMLHAVSLDQLSMKMVLKDGREGSQLSDRHKPATVKNIDSVKKRSLSSISIFLKVQWPSDSIKSGQLPTKCFGFGIVNISLFLVLIVYKE